MSQLIIQKANPVFLKDLQKIARQTFKETYTDGNTAENMERYLEENLSLAQLAKEIEDVNSEFYFALLDSEVVGYLKVNHTAAQKDPQEEETLEIERIYVSLSQQGQGIGQALLAKAIEIAKVNKVSYLWLGVWEHNPKAFQFYQKHGFEVFGTHVFVLGDEEQIDFLMKLKL